MSDQTPKEDALCIYELCGCGASTDGHCMMCLRPITEHRLIPTPEIVEIQERFTFYDKEIATLTARCEEWQRRYEVTSNALARETEELRETTARCEALQAENAALQFKLDGGCGRCGEHHPAHVGCRSNWTGVDKDGR